MTAPRGGRAGDWGPLYRAGAVAAGSAAVVYVAALVIVTVSPVAASSDGVALLEHVAAHRTLYLVRQLLWLAPSLFLMVTSLALTVAMWGRHRARAAVAGLISVSSWAISLAWPTTGDGSLAMVVLSDRYVATTDEGVRASYVAGAELLSALNDVPAVIGVLQTLGILLLGLLMLRGVFARALALLGVATGTVGIVAEVLRPVLGWGYAAYGLLLWVWLGRVAVALWRLGRAGAPPRIPSGSAVDVPA